MGTDRFERTTILRGRLAPSSCQRSTCLQQLLVLEDDRPRPWLVGLHVGTIDAIDDPGLDGD